MKNTKLLRYANSQIFTQGSVVAIGNFDGVHNGHKKIMAQAHAKAQLDNLKSVVLTFNPYPFQLFAGVGVSQRLSKVSDQYRTVAALGVDVLYVQKFNHNLAQMTPEEFVENVLVNTLNAKHVFVGEDFHFGAKRAGNVDTLKALGAVHGFAVHVQTDVMCTEGERFSSSRTRVALKDGDVTLARELLGHFWSARVRLVENDFCDLVADLSAYTPVKDGGYWVKLTFTTSADGGQMSAIIPVILRNQKMVIKPLESLPDILEGMATVEFIEPLHELGEGVGCSHGHTH